MNSSVTLAFGFALVLVLCVSFTQGAVGPRCAPSDDYSEPHDCPYGKVTDNCGRKVCAKGPGEHCGIGVFQVLGICGEGTFCRCGRCIGCSLHSFECFDKTCMN